MVVKQLKLRLQTFDLALFRNASWMLGAHGGRLLVQSAYFVLLARWLGAIGFGTFTSALSLAYMLLPFSGWGAGNILVQKVARDRSSLPVHLGNALVISSVSGTLLALALGLFGPWILPTVPVQLIVSVAIAELVFGRVVDVSAQAFQALENLAFTARITLTLTGCRLLAAVTYVLVTPEPTTVLWGYYYLTASAVFAVVVGFWTIVKFGWPRFDLNGFLNDAKLGWYFAVGSSAQTVYTDLDKTMLARMGTLESVGIYSVAYRVISLAFSPIRALLFASYARFFQYGRRGIKGSLELARRLVPISAAYGLVATLGLLVFAPLVGKVLGSQYDEAVTAIRWLAMVPFFQGFHYFAADTLTGAGFQGTRTAVQIGIAVLNAALNFVLIPRYSWSGAAWATIVSEAALALCLWGTVLYLNARRKEATVCLTE